MQLDLWQVRRLGTQLEIEARLPEIAEHGALAVRDFIRLKYEELDYA